MIDHEAETEALREPPLRPANSSNTKGTANGRWWENKRRKILGITAVVLGVVVVMYLAGKPSSDTVPTDEGGNSAVPQDQEENAFLTSVGSESDNNRGGGDGDEYGQEQQCDSRKPRPAKGTKEYDMLAADCGLGYDPTLSPANGKPWTVALYGRGFHDETVLTLSGCMTGRGRCPHSPNCTIFRTEHRNRDLLSADVVMIFQKDYTLVDEIYARKAKKRQYRVLYWREAFWTAPPKEDQHKFDFNMGVHWFSALWNPNFAKTPSKLLGGLEGYGLKHPLANAIPVLSARERTHFALSIISHCHASSRRDNYIESMTNVLGKERIHHYGKCGDRTLPPPPIKNAAAVIAKYKFYLSFENMIQDGYVTEKLLIVLQMPVIPVYYGTPKTPNITKSKSFIRASDFGHPSLLAQYLLYLDSHNEEYDKFHEWRKQADAFHPQFLELISQKTPGPVEVDPIRAREVNIPDHHRFNRAAACCRLCDENFVKGATKFPREIIEPPWGPTRIYKEFWGMKT